MRSWWVAAAVGMAVLLSGCATEAAGITGVEFDETSTELQVLVGTCNRDPAVSAVEGDAITLSAQVRRRLSLPGSDACIDVVSVALTEPVGQRVVRDDAGNEFEPLTPPS